MAETREVASILSAVLDSDDDEPDPVTRTAASTATGASSVAVPALRGLENAVATLDPQYHAALTELVKKPAWMADEVRALGARLKLMPGGILETINSWSDEHLGEYLIDDRGDWHVRTDLLGRPEG